MLRDKFTREPVNDRNSLNKQRVSMPLHPLVSEVADKNGGVKATHTRITAFTIAFVFCVRWVEQTVFVT